MSTPSSEGLGTSGYGSGGGGGYLMSSGAPSAPPSTTQGDSSTDHQGGGTDYSGSGASATEANLSRGAITSRTQPTRPEQPSHQRGRPPSLDQFNDEGRGVNVGGYHADPLPSRRSRTAWALLLMDRSMQSTTYALNRQMMPMAPAMV